jgi:ribosomal protein S18 acetylase RimI-like enzyme
MSAIEVRPFNDDDIAGASEVLERSHHAHLIEEPLLASGVDFEVLVRKEREDATGAVALRGGTVVGYLLGRHGSGWLGPHVWSTSAGHATDDPGLVPDLYAVAAARWVEEGLPRHFIFASADQAHVEPWFRVGFGASAWEAVRPIPGPALDRGRGDIHVRLSEPDDLHEIATLARELPLHLRASPSFSEIVAESEESLRDEWRDTWLKDEYTHFVAEVDGRIVGQLLLYRRPMGDLRIPPNSIDLSNATTLPEHRGVGVGRALTRAAIAWADGQGISAMTIDWRATNLLAARMWPRVGFRSTFLRLYRSIP